MYINLSVKAALEKTIYLAARAVAATALGLSASAIASPPPAPEELKYPNIIKPVSQFGTFGSDKGQLNEPASIDYGANGTLYIADLNNHRVVHVTQEGLAIKEWGSLGAGAQNLKFPRAIAVDHVEGDVYVADTGNERIQVYHPDGKLKLSIKAPLGQRFVQLNSVAVKGNRLIASDIATNKIHVFNKQGKHEATFGQTGIENGEFDQPSDVAIDSHGNIFVADTYNNRIQKFDSRGRHLKSWGEWGSHAGFLASPTGMKISGNRVYIADLINHRIQVFTTEGEFLYQWGRHPAIAHEGMGRLHYPQALALSPDGKSTVVCEPFEYRCQVFINDIQQSIARVDDSAWWDKATRFHYGTKVRAKGSLLAIAEPDTHSVLVFDNSGAVPKLITKLGGQGREPGQFVRPSGMEIDETKGEILVSDGGNHRLQLFQLRRGADGKNFIPNNASFVKAVSLLEIAPKAVDGPPPAPIEPSAIIKAKDGLYYVADPHNARVLVLDSELKYLRSIGKYGTKKGEFLVPSNLEFSPDNEILYVVDTYSFRVQAFDRNGKYLFHWGKPGISSSQFMHAFGIGVDKEGNIYIGDDGANRIQKFNSRGKFIKKWGKWGTEPGQFYKPKGVTVDPQDRVIVMNFGNHRGEIFDTEGAFIDMFGIADGYTIPVARLEQHVSDRTSNAGTYVVTYRTNPESIMLNKPFEVEVQVVDSKFREPAPDDLALSVDAIMPAHNHGMNIKPTIERTGKGAWIARGLNFHMPGYWRLTVDLTRGGITERAEFDINIAP